MNKAKAGDFLYSNVWIQYKYGAQNETYIED